MKRYVIKSGNHDVNFLYVRRISFRWVC